MCRVWKLLFIGFLLFLNPLWGLNPEVESSLQPKICLAMTVKDDEEFIEACLNSAKGMIDCISICDLGSKDKTITIIEQFIKETGIPGKIHHYVHNKSHPYVLSAKAAQETLNELSFSLAETYLLFIDADTVLNIQPGFKKVSLNEDSYLLLEKSSTFGFNYYKPHLFLASFAINGNEKIYYNWPYHKKSSKLQSLIIDDQGTENYKTEKLKRNITHLSRAIQDSPLNESHLFYLAQSYKRLKRYDEAIHWYEARLKVEGDKEELWFSKYMMGECYEEMGQWDHALYWYLETFQSNPNMPDPLQKIATHYRLRGQNDLAYIFAKHGLQIPFSQDQHLFHSPPLYGYQLDEEVSIVAYYTRFRDEGYTASDHLILRKDTPWYIKEQSHRNILFYVQNLKNAHFQSIDIELPLIQEGYSQRYHPMNPSIQKTDEGYLVICRAVNYTQIGAKIFDTIDLNGIYRTKNFLLHYDRNLQLLDQKEIIENLPRERFRSCNVEGLEDCRLIQWNNNLWFTCTTLDTNYSGQPQISLCKLAKDSLNGAIPVDKLLPLKGPDPYRCEKNWVPFLAHEDFSNPTDRHIPAHNTLPHVIYSYDPLIIYQLNVKTGDCKTVLHREFPYDFSFFRGSAAPIEFDEGYLVLIHEVVHQPDYTRCYLHRFLYFDKNFNISKLSRPFTFQHNGIEFCSSMTMNHSGTQLLMAVGIEDSRAYLCSVDPNTVRSLLFPLPSIANTPPFP